MGCANLREKQTSIHILLAGLDRSGKSTLLYTLDEVEETNAYIPTKSLVVYDIKIHDTSLIFYDTGGKKELRSQWHNHLGNKDALFYFIDASDENRFGEAFEELRKLLDDNRTEEYPVYVFFNKMDKATNIDEQNLRKRVKEVFADKETNYQVHFISGLKNQNLEPVLKDVIRYYFPPCVLQKPKGTLARNLR